MTINIYSLWIGLIIFFQLSGFYLLDQRVIPTSDIALMLEVFFFVYVYIHNKKYRYKSEYSVWFAMVVVLSILSSFRALENYGQPFILGLRPQRAWIMAMLMYFPLNRLIKMEKYSIENLLKTIDVCNAIFIVLIIAQYIVADNYLFLNLMYNFRYGSIRLYAFVGFLWISFMKCFCDVLEDGRWNFKRIFYIVSPIFILFFVTKSRMLMVSVLATITIMIMRQKFTKKKLIAVIAFIILLSLFMYLPVGQDIVSMIFKPEMSEENTSEIRELGREFYMMRLLSSKKDMILGCGYPNDLWKRAVEGAGFTQNIYVVDNGIFGQVFIYGLLYLIWDVTLYLKVLKKSIANNIRFIVGVLLIQILSCYSYTQYCSMPYILFPMSIAITENMNKLNTNKD